MQYEQDFLRQLHKNLLETRMLEEKLVDIYAQGIVPGHIHSGQGQEGTYVGVLSTRKPGDYVKIGHRPIGITHMMGNPLEVFFGEVLGKTTGNAGGRGGVNHLGRLQDGMIGFSGSLGCDASVPLGAAITIDAEGRDNVAYAFFGDGTASRGPVHEAMCMASCWKLPVLFVCENNQYAISTPSAYSSAVPNPMADRAAGYAMPSAVVDGTDVLAVSEAAKRLTDGIRAGGGPAVLECRSYRWRGHFEGDQCAYRDTEVTRRWIEEKDCLKNLEAALVEQGILSPGEIAGMRSGFMQEMDEAIRAAQAAPEMQPSEIYDYLYV